MINDPFFWATAVLAVLVTGISKGGFGGLALFAVPLMALTISPLQSAGIMLPILIVMDCVSFWSYRKHWDKNILILMLPGAVAGIVVGAILAGYMNDRIVLICVGVIAILFPLYAVTKPKGRKDIIVGNKFLGVVAGVASGFTSFVAHAGGPPFQAYALPQNLEKRVLLAPALCFSLWSI